MKAHIWKTGPTILSVSVMNLERSIALCGQGKFSWDFCFLNTNLLFKHTIIFVKKEKKN